MHRRAHADIVVALFVCSALSLPSVAQEEVPERYVVAGLQRISLASVADWENDWEYSRAVAGATILAWFHDRGYVELLTDQNADGMTDELDAIKLADRLGKDSMSCGEAQTPTDAWLVVGLARHVANRYPGGFELRIYDPGFPTEFEQTSGIPFAPDAIPGILLTVESEPTFAAYMTELMDEAGVILGLEQEAGCNLYFTGRSFLRSPIAPDTYGIDLLWPQEDWFALGTQSKVLETSARQTDAFFVDYQGEWMTVESMVALGSLFPRVSVSSEVVCDDGTSTDGASVWTVTVEAAVRKTGEAPIESDFDIVLEYVGDDGSAKTITKTVTPQDINPTGSATLVFMFLIARPDSGLSPCTYSLMGFWGGLPGPILVVAGVVGVPQAIHGDESGNGFFYGEGCCEDVQDCLDLAISVEYPSCSCEDILSETWHPEPTYPQGGWWEIEVVGETCEAKVRYTVQNVGTKDAGPFRVRIETSSGHTDTADFSGLSPGGNVSRWFDFVVDDSGPITITLIADSEGELDECDEENNTLDMTLFCN